MVEAEPLQEGVTERRASPPCVRDLKKVAFKRIEIRHSEDFQEAGLDLLLDGKVRDDGQAYAGQNSLLDRGRAAQLGDDVELAQTDAERLQVLLEDQTRSRAGLPENERFATQLLEVDGVDLSPS